MDIPQGITFGTKVVVIPGYLSGFTHSGNIRTYEEKRNYRWVKRGEPIGEFVIEGSYDDSFLARLFNTKLHSSSIKSPVSGLVLHPTLSHELHSYLEEKNWNSMKNPPIANYALLLPDDEPKPESGNYIYSDMCRLIQNMKHYYFKKSRYWSMGEFSEDGLEGLIKNQLNADPLIFDALPKWSGYLDEARTVYPELRPYLKHLSTSP